MEIRRATSDDMTSILRIYARAREFMAANGNPDQWGNTYPPQAQIEDDIANNALYLCVSGDDVLGVFYYREGDDESYRTIDGAWQNDLPYAVVHRIASSGSVRGTAEFCLRYAFDLSHNLRIDTHRQNIPMQNLLAKLGFVRCGTIELSDGTERIVYQKTE